MWCLWLQYFTIKYWWENKRNGNTLYWFWSLWDTSDQHLEGRDPTPGTVLFVWQPMASRMNSIPCVGNIYILKCIYISFQTGLVFLVEMKVLMQFNFFHFSFSLLVLFMKASHISPRLLTILLFPPNTTVFLMSPSVY